MILRLTRRPGRTRTAAVVSAAVVAMAALAGCAVQPQPEPAAAPATLGAAAASFEKLAAALPQSTLPAGFDAWSAAVKTNVTARSEPDPSAPAVKEFGNENGFQDQEVFRVIDERSTPTGTWYHVLLPIPPNGSKAWVPADAVTVKGQDQKLVVHLGTRTMQRFSKGAVVANFSVGIGKPETPTPSGPSYLWAKVTREQGSPPVYGAGVLGLAAMSPTLSDWQGSDPRIGIHGAIRPTDLGSVVSHGCVRMDNDALKILLAELPVGTPVDIEA